MAIPAETTPRPIIDQRVSNAGSVIGTTLLYPKLKECNQANTQKMRSTFLWNYLGNYVVEPEVTLRFGFVRKKQLNFETMWPNTPTPILEMSSVGFQFREPTILMDSLSG